ncbi:glycoside hydrolase family 16 protein [Nocardioides montaniterrae]
MATHSPTPTRRRRVRTLLATAAVVTTSVAALLVAPGSTPAAGAATTAPSCGLQIYKSDGTPWTCTFADNFSGTSLDTSKWLVGQTSTTGFTVGNTCFEPDNVAVGGGLLKLTARDTGQPFTCTSPAGSFTTRYTGGHIGTNGRFAQTYGRFEVRARYPLSGPGLHGGFWMYPVKQTYGAWPASGEIDVAEWWSAAATVVLPTLHYNTSQFLADSGWLCTVSTPTLWHTYAVVWAPTVMQFSIDGTPCFTRSWTPDAPLVAPQPFDQPFNMILNMAVDTNSTTNVVTPATILPATYEVDYAKAWR